MPDSVGPGVKLVETANFKVAKDKEKRFLALVESGALIV